MQNVPIRFLTSAYESRQAGTLILRDYGTYFDAHAHHSEKDLALVRDIYDVLADIVRRADKLRSLNELTMNTEFVKLGSKNIIFHVARHEQCISVFVLSAARRINVLLLGNLRIDSHSRPGGQHWADYLQSILSTITRQSQMLAISRLWSKGDQEWSLDAEEPAEPSGSARAEEPSGASRSGTRAEPSGASRSSTRAEPSGGARAEPSGARAEPSGGARAEPSGARAEHAHPTARRPLDQCQASGGWCLKHSGDRENTETRRTFQALWRKLLQIETELQSNGHLFDLEDQQTWPTLEELGGRIPNIFLKRFPTIQSIKDGQVLAHDDRCDGHHTSCPTQQCCRIAFDFMNYLYGMKTGWPKRQNTSPY